MTTLRMTFAALGLSAFSGLALAAGNPLSVHVLNLENGLPSPGVNVTLENTSARTGSHWPRAPPTSRDASPNCSRPNSLSKRANTGWCSRPASISRRTSARRFSRRSR